MVEFGQYNKPSMQNQKQLIKQKALSLGFDLAGITVPGPLGPVDIEHLRSFLSMGRAAEMQYMHRNFEKRTNPSKLLENAQSVICLAINYKPVAQPKSGIANYALYEDYHGFIKKRLLVLAEFIKSKFKPDLKIKACVDSVPLAERALAARAGLGFIGKNRMLINPTLGPQLLLGELITNLPLEPDEKIELSCAGCNKCIKACPTGALSDDGTFDARKCISYLTTEHKGDIPVSLARKIDSSLFGCDRCLLACPYSSASPACKNKDFQFFPERAKIKPGQIAKFSKEDFSRLFSNSPVYRIGIDQLKRNSKICIQNAVH